MGDLNAIIPQMYKHINIFTYFSRSSIQIYMDFRLAKKENLAFNLINPVI